MKSPNLNILSILAVALAREDFGHRVSVLTCNALPAEVVTKLGLDPNSVSCSMELEDGAHDAEALANCEDPCIEFIPEYDEDFAASLYPFVILRHFSNGALTDAGLIAAMSGMLKEEGRHPDHTALIERYASELMGEMEDLAPRLLEAAAQLEEDGILSGDDFRDYINND